MNQNPKDPHLRKGKPLFTNNKNTPTETLPLGAPAAAHTLGADTPTLPMPGGGGTLPLVPGSTPTEPMVAGPKKENNKDQIGPVAGWLVVISGPGRGRSMEVGYGYNSIGRNACNTVALDFGDTTISDSEHAYIIYDNLGHKSYVTHGRSRNVIYLDNAPVLGSLEIKEGNLLRIGNTMLMFIPFCSAERNWSLFPESIS